MWTDLVTANEDRRDLSSLVQPGSRAVSIQMAREGSSVALIRPGDYVDVFSVMNEKGADQKIAVVLLQRVLVLATGLDTSPDAVQLRMGQGNQNRVRLSPYAEPPGHRSAAARPGAGEGEARRRPP